MSATGKAIRAGKNMPVYPGRDVIEAVLGPVVLPAGTKLAGAHLQRLLGYWVLVNVLGSREAIIDQKLLSRASAYRNEREFREALGIEVQDLTVERVFGGDRDDVA